MGYAIKSACDLVLTNLANSEDTTTIDFLNSFNITTESENFEAYKKGDLCITIAGQRKGTLQMDAQVIDDFFLCQMLGGELQGTKISVRGTIPSKYYSMEGNFLVVNEDGTQEVKKIKFAKAKAQPNADLTISAQEISDFSLTWDLLVDDTDLILEIDKGTQVGA